MQKNISQPITVFVFIQYLAEETSWVIFNKKQGVPIK